jgi:Flp pilus assembly pilin Flp
MGLIARWWKSGTGVVAVEYLLLAAIVGIALVVGGTNLVTALSVGTGDPPAPASAGDGGKTDG